MVTYRLKTLVTNSIILRITKLTIVKHTKTQSVVSTQLFAVVADCELCQNTVWADGDSVDASWVNFSCASDAAAASTLIMSAENLSTGRKSEQQKK